MALSMEYNVVQVSVAASLGDTYSGGPIFDSVRLSRINLAEFAGWTFVMLRASIVCGLFV